MDYKCRTISDAKVVSLPLYLVLLIFSSCIGTRHQHFSVNSMRNVDLSGPYVLYNFTITSESLHSNDLQIRPNTR